jgi:hypothetical protein
MAKRTYTMNAFGYLPKVETPNKASGGPQITSSLDVERGVFEFNVPKTAIGATLPFLIGRRRIRANNIIWQGSLRAITSTSYDVQTTSDTIDGEVVTTTKSVRTTFVIGYKVSMMMAICLGPGVKLRAIYNGDDIIWSGTLGPTRETATLPTNDTYLSGCAIAFHGGNFDQPVEPLVTDADFPAHVGTAYVLIQDMRADLPMDDISFEVERYPNPLSLNNTSSSANRNQLYVPAAGPTPAYLADDINVMSAIAEVLTQEWGGGGLDVSNLDVTQLTAMADTLHGESNFASVLVSDEQAVSGIVAELQEQAGCLMYQDPETGLITGKLIRPEEINPATVPKLGTRNSKVSEFRKDAWPNTIEQLRGEFTERGAGYEINAVFAQNSANLSNSGRGRRTGSVQYPFVMTNTLAQTLLSRDLAVLAAPIFTATIEANRDAATLTPGDVVYLFDTVRSLYNVPALVTKVRKQPLDDNSVTVYCRQIKFPDNTPTLSLPADGFDPSDDVNPQPPTDVIFVDAPYFIARSALGYGSGNVTALAFPIALATPYNDLQFSFGAKITNIPAAGGDTTVISNGAYPTYAEMKYAIDRYDNTVTGIIPTMYIKGVINDINLYDIDESGVREGKLFLFVGDEIMSFESCVSTGGGEWTLTNVHRGLLDTVARSHSADDPIFIINSLYSNVPSYAWALPIAYTPDWKLTGNTLSAEGDESDYLGAASWTPTEVRVLSPLRPHYTQVNAAARSGTALAVTIGASTLVTWANRRRISTEVKLQADATEAPETGQRHRVIVVDSALAVHDCGVTGSATTASLTFNLPTMATGAAVLYVQAELTIGGNAYVSLAQDYIPLMVS